MTSQELEFVYILDNDRYEDDEPIVEDKEPAKTCYRDKDMFNRFWFEFPPEWRTSSQKERVIGLRTFWVSKTYRHLQFDLSVRYYKDDGQGSCAENEFTVPINSWLDYTKDLREIWIDLRSALNRYIEKHREEWEREGKPVPSIDMFGMNYEYYKDEDLNQRILCNILYTNDNNVTVMVSNLNHDARAVLNCEDPPEEYARLIRFKNVWDRHSILLKSSICNNNTSNYLGYSHKNYYPIKYFKINCSEPRFYIDLYHGHKHDIPINLPVDERESIILEIVIPA